jgi:HEAT repeat protein
MGANAAGAVGPLIDLLASSDAGSRLSACVALGHIGQAAGLPALRAALSDQALNRCAARSIQRIEQ